MSLENLATTPVTDAVDYGNLPEQMGSFAPPLPPGDYVFALSPLTGANFDKTESADFKDRVKVKFDENAPLVVVQSLGGKHDGEPMQITITNIPINRARKGQPPVMVSDWDYLNQALGLKQRPATARAYAEALMPLAAARTTFRATVEWSWRCDEKREAYFATDAGGYSPIPNDNGQPGNKLGCGTKYYQNNIDKDPTTNEYPLRVQCSTCGASVRAFPRVRNFQPVSPA